MDQGFISNLRYFSLPEFCSMQGSGFFLIGICSLEINQLLITLTKVILAKCFQKERNMG